MNPQYLVLHRKVANGGTYVRLQFLPVIDLEVVDEMDFYDQDKKAMTKVPVKKNNWAEVHTYFVREDEEEKVVLSKAVWNHQHGLEKIKAERDAEVRGEVERFDCLDESQLI